ncbi:unnamed protein product [Schistocephalus solidus]|uniref:Organic solute transporter Ostalpha-domain-containing protein n=1 Tax=Schistocephalus solidus TaxID=70667 RepID=A0A183SP80_SCHSO|nr:unnamed protein product [Schistocephalus solidus]
MSITFSARSQSHGPTTEGGHVRAHYYIHSVSISAGVVTGMLDNLFSLYYNGNTPKATDAVLVKSRLKNTVSIREGGSLTSRDEGGPKNFAEQEEETPKYFYQLFELAKRSAAVHENIKVFRHREQKYVVVQASKQ